MNFFPTLYKVQHSLDRRTMLQAWNLCFYSGAIGVLFNLMVPWGIDLRGNLPASPLPCQEAGPSPRSGVALIAAPTSAKVTRLSLTGARNRYGREGTLFLDARPMSDYRRGHIAGALSFDANEFEARAPEVLPLVAKAEEIIVYCSGGTCADSTELSSHLALAGYPGAKVFEEGLDAWRKAGLPVQKGETP